MYEDENKREEKYKHFLDFKDFLFFSKKINSHKIACIGAGYVGGPTMAIIAYKCPHIQVHVLDICESRIKAWNSDELPLYEPGLQEIVKKCRGKNLHFSSNLAKGINECDIIFVCVSTPTKKVGVGAGAASDLTNWELAGRCIAKNAKSHKVVIEKSTVPVRTAEALSRVLQATENNNARFCILSNPEFLSEGTAVDDLLLPDRVLIGGAINTAIGKFSINLLSDIYANWIDRSKIITTNLWSAELSKLVANAFLAQRISSINAISHLCEKTGADITEVSYSVGLDSRIGHKFLHSSVGFGGSCFKKDLLNLVYLCESFGLKEAAEYWLQVVKMNEHQKYRFASKVVEAMFNTISGKKIAVFGFAYKKNTSDIRETPAVDVCAALINEGAILYIYDPKVSHQQILNECRSYQKEKNYDFDLDQLLHCVENPYIAMEGAHAIVILTEWDEFTTYDYKKFYSHMEKPAFIFDGRNILDNKSLWEYGFNVYSIGRSPLLQGNYISNENGFNDFL